MTIPAQVELFAAFVTVCEGQAGSKEHKEAVVLIKRLCRIDPIGLPNKPAPGSTFEHYLAWLRKEARKRGR